MGNFTLSSVLFKERDPNTPTPGIGFLLMNTFSILISLSLFVTVLMAEGYAAEEGALGRPPVHPVRVLQGIHPKADELVIQEPPSFLKLLPPRFLQQRQFEAFMHSLQQNPNLFPTVIPQREHPPYGHLP
jgi:hypothetical protein